MPTITKIKAITGFAGSITAGSGTTVTHAANVYTVALDISGLGIVIGPSSVTDNQLARFDGTTGKLLQNCPIVVDDSGNMSGGTWTGTTVGVAYGGTGVTTTGALRDLVAPYTQPVSYSPAVTSGHVIPYLDSDAQFGNQYSQYPLGMVSTNPICIGKAGCTIGSATNGQTFKIVFTSSGLTGSPITITYTAGAGETVTTVAEGLAALVNANTTLHGTGGKPIFMQSLGSGVFNLQYDSTFTATGATPLTTATTGSTGTITLASETDALDYIIFQLGRNISGRAAKVGDALVSFDFTGQDSTGSFNTHYAQISVSVSDPTAGAAHGKMIFSTGTGIDPEFEIDQGIALYDASNVVATGGTVAIGTINVPTTGGYYLAGNAVAINGAMYAPGGNVFGGAANGSTLNLQSTQSGTPSADFVQIKAGGVVGYKYNGTSSAFSNGAVVPSTNDGVALGTTALQWSDLFLASGGVINFNNGDTSISHAVATGGQLAFSGAASGYQFDAVLYPASNDGAALGQATLQWSDLFLAEGAVINFDNGDVTVTQSGNSLTVAGGNLIFPGTATNDSASAGQVGEIQTSQVLVGSAVSLTNGTPANVTSVSLTAGDWDIEGNVCFDPAPTTTWTVAHAWTSTTSAAAPTAPNNGAYTQIGAPLTTGADQFLPVGTQRISINATTTVYLSCLAGFATSTMVAYGYLRARRVR